MVYGLLVSNAQEIADPDCRNEHFSLQSPTTCSTFPALALGFVMNFTTPIMKS